jgi:hypothetical protein
MPVERQCDFSAHALILQAKLAMCQRTEMMLMAVRADIMGQFAITRRLTILGWLATATMAAVVLAMFATWVQ